MITVPLTRLTVTELADKLHTADAIVAKARETGNYSIAHAWEQRADEFAHELSTRPEWVAARQHNEIRLIGGL